MLWLGGSAQFVLFRLLLKLGFDELRNGARIGGRESGLVFVFWTLGVARQWYRLVAEVIMQELDCIDEFLFVKFFVRERNVFFFLLERTNYLVGKICCCKFSLS